MGVDETRNKVAALAVYHFPGRIQLGTYVLILHMSDKSVIDEYVRR